MSPPTCSTCGQPVRNETNALAHLEGRCRNATRPTQPERITYGTLVREYGVRRVARAAVSIAGESHGMSKLREALQRETKNEGRTNSSKESEL